MNKLFSFSLSTNAAQVAPLILTAAAVFLCAATVLRAQQASVQARSAVAQSSTRVAAPNAIVAGSAVQLRENAAANGASVGKLKFGALVTSLERAAQPETINGKTDFWQRVATNDNRTGWVFGAFLKPFDRANADRIKLQIARERFKTVDRPFADNAELYDFLTESQGAIKDPKILPEIALLRLLALKDALAAMPFDKIEQAPYKTFVNANAINIVYSEPAGAWYVRSERFWSLATKFKNLPIGERIAWEAARIYLPGECEGYINCILYAMRQQDGEYLKRYPNGAHAAESLKQIRETLESINEDNAQSFNDGFPVEAAERAEFNRSIADLRAIVARTALPEKNAVSAQFDKLVKSAKR